VGAVRVLTVDNHVAFRDAARALVDATPGFEMAGEVASGEEAVPAALRLRPDLVLMDVRLPGIDGYEAARRLGPARPETVVVLISAAEEALQGTVAETCGAVAFVRKQDLRPSLLTELWRIHGPSGAHG
jgi:two-component system, NarL family, invasion response regulator UvrY